MKLNKFILSISLLIIFTLIIGLFVLKKYRNTCQIKKIEFFAHDRLLPANFPISPKSFLIKCKKIKEVTSNDYNIKNPNKDLRIFYSNNEKTFFEYQTDNCFFLKKLEKKIELLKETKRGYFRPFGVLKIYYSGETRTMVLANNYVYFNNKYYKIENSSSEDTLIDFLYRKAPEEFKKICFKKYKVKPDSSEETNFDFLKKY